MYKLLILVSFVFIMSGCTQMVTAPIKVTGAVVSTTFDVAGSAVDAVVPDGKEEED